MNIAEFFVRIEALVADQAVNPERFTTLIHGVEVEQIELPHIVLLCLGQLDRYKEQVTDGVIRSLVDDCHSHEYERFHVAAMVAASWVSTQEELGRYRDTWQWLDGTIRSIEYLYTDGPVPQRTSLHRPLHLSATIDIVRRGSKFLVHLGPSVEDTQEMPAVTDEMLRAMDTPVPETDPQTSVRA